MARAAAPEAVKHERHDGEAGDGIAVEILRPGIVEAVEIELEKGGRRPDEHGREDGGVTLGECSRSFRHFFQAFGKRLFDWKENSAGLQSNNLFI